MCAQISLTVSIYPGWEFGTRGYAMRASLAGRGQQPRAYSKLISLALASPPATTLPGGSTG